MNLLTMEHVTKSYTDRMLLDDVGFGIQEGEKIGVIGVNGMGKSTLLKLAAGVEDCDEGQISTGNQIRISYLSQTPSFSEEDTVLQAASDLQADDWELWNLETEVKSMLNRLGFTDYDEKVGHMSGGQRKRIALVRALAAKADILILDEPTNHLDHAMSEWLEEYLIQYRGALLMVTHDRYFLDRVSTRIVEVDQGKIYSYPGNYSEYVRLKEERENSALASQRKRKSLLRTELMWLNRGARARSTKQKAHIDRIRAMQEMKDIQEEKNVQLSSVSSRMGNKTIELSHVTKSYQGRKIIDDFNYIFLKKDRIGIIGPNGCGKTTLLNLISGKRIPDAGDVEVGQTIRMGYFSQENEYMDETLRVIDYIREEGEYVTTEEGKISASQMLERFLFDGTMQWSRIQKLSGGEKRRLYLLRILMGAPNVLLLDEPTNDLDIQTLTVLEDYLDHFDGIVIIVSHDRYFLDRTVNRIFAVEDGGKIRQYEGGYSDYLIRKELEQPLEPVRQPDEKERIRDQEPKDRGRRQNKTLKFTFNEQREYQSIDGEIADLEKQLELLDSSISENATNSAKLNELLEEKEEKERQLEAKMERWVYLNEKKEQMEQ